MTGIRLEAVETCPLWEDGDGARTVAYERQDHPPVVGWCNVAVVTIGGKRHRLLLTLDAT